MSLFSHRHKSGFLMTRLMYVQSANRLYSFSPGVIHVIIRLYMIVLITIILQVSALIGLNCFDIFDLSQI